MQIYFLAAIAAGFISSLRLGPLVVVPLAAIVVLLSFVLGLKISGSRFLAAGGLVASLNVGYLLGAALSWHVARSRRLQSIPILRWLIR